MTVPARTAMTATALLVLSACGSSPTTHAATSTLSPGAPAASASTAAQPVNASGTKDVSALAAVDLQAVNFAFSPSTLIGRPGQHVVLKVHNGTTTPHNITVKADQVNSDLAAGHTVSVSVTFPMSGQLTFTCEYHAARGMAGVLSAGPATTASSAGSTTGSAGGNAGY